MSFPTDHPDTLCDAAVDTIVEAARRMDPGGQCGLEASCVFDTLHITSRIRWPGRLSVGSGR